MSRDDASPSVQIDLACLVIAQMSDLQTLPQQERRSPPMLGGIQSFPNPADDGESQLDRERRATPSSRCPECADRRRSRPRDLAVVGQVRPCLALPLSS